MQITILSGGIGGLTAALTLRQFGFEPQVSEQRPSCWKWSSYRNVACAEGAARW
jgi:2-polyprenyl-6-methoxyphenol hydroxylase-like FAD-dependent oxidoreductase